jgi:hypothetical protein
LAHGQHSAWQRRQATASRHGRQIDIHRTGHRASTMDVRSGRDQASSIGPHGNTPSAELEILTFYGCVWKFVISKGNFRWAGGAGPAQLSRDRALAAPV